MDISFKKSKQLQKVIILILGGYGYVCKVFDVHKPEIKYAIKKINIMDDANDQAVKREISNWESLGVHPNICRFLAYTQI